MSMSDHGDTGCHRWHCYHLPVTHNIHDFKGAQNHTGGKVTDVPPVVLLSAPHNVRALKGLQSHKGVQNHTGRTVNRCATGGTFIISP